MLSLMLMKVQIFLLLNSVPCVLYSTTGATEQAGNYICLFFSLHIETYNLDPFEILEIFFERVHSDIGKDSGFSTILPDLRYIPSVF